MDVLKKWLDPSETENTWMRPHGWRFSCRDRKDTIKGYKARYRNPDCETDNPDCCGLVDLVECELPVCRKSKKLVVYELKILISHLNFKLIGANGPHTLIAPKTASKTTLLLTMVTRYSKALFYLLKKEKLSYRRERKQ